jgi:hypothetical protein
MIQRHLMALFVALVFAAPLRAEPLLQNVRVIEDGLFSIAVADKIRKECNDISARMLRAHSRLRALYKHARDLGYSEETIKAHVSSSAQKTRMRSKRDAYFAKHGVVQGEPETYCFLGLAEIAHSSQIGALLRAR